MPLQYILDQDLAVADFVVRSKLASGFEKGNVGFTDPDLKAIGVARDGELIAGIVYFNHRRDAGTIEMSIDATPGHFWLSRQTLAWMYQYPFLDLGCQMLITRTAGRSEHVQRMLAAMNFTLVRIPRAGGPDEDGVLALLTYEDWVAAKFCRRYGHADRDARRAA